MSTERNKARVLELVDRVLNGHDLAALTEFTSNPGIIGSATGLLTAFPDLAVDVEWIVAEGDMVVLFHSMSGTHQGPWLFVHRPTDRTVQSALLLAFRFDDDGQIADQWLGSNFVQMLTQIGWGFAPVGDTARLPH